MYPPDRRYVAFAGHELIADGSLSDVAIATRTFAESAAVDATLAGFDQGETITIPSLPDPADWNALTAARLPLAPKNLSHAKPAARYRLG